MTDVRSKNAGRNSGLNIPGRSGQNLNSKAEDSTPVISSGGSRLGWRIVVEQTVTGLGYDLVDLERSPRGLLRVFIDRRSGRSYPSGDSEFVTVDDCEAVTRQLLYALEVDGAAYERLEVSSPGLDRPLKTPADFERFSGLEISLTLKMPFQGRKVWKGVLQAAAGAWSLNIKDGKDEQVLGFALDEVREARLVPVVDFKGRRNKTADAVQEPAAKPGIDGGQDR